MKYILYFFIFLSSSSLINQQEDRNELLKYKGWWIYGEDQHIFKDETTLGEWSIQFLNEDLIDLKALYLAIAETEYLPIECTMQAKLSNDTLLVEDFDITYIKGCDENYLSE